MLKYSCLRKSLDTLTKQDFPGGLVLEQLASDLIDENETRAKKFMAPVGVYNDETDEVWSENIDAIKAAIVSKVNGLSFEQVGSMIVDVTDEELGTFEFTEYFKNLPNRAVQLTYDYACSVVVEKLQELVKVRFYS